MAVDDLGLALTQPVQVPPQNPLAESLAFLEDPTTRAAMLSAGLQLMQPVGVGQTPLGHFAQAIGAAGEAVTRREQLDLKQDMEANKLQAIQQRMDLAQQRADQAAANRSQQLSLAEQRLAIAQQRGASAAEIAQLRLQLEREKLEAVKGYRGARLDQIDRGLDQGAQRIANSGGEKGLTANARAAAERRAEAEHNRRIDMYAKSAADAVKNAMITPERDQTPEMKRFKGMSLPQIREILAKENPYVPKSYGAPASTPAATEDDDDEEDDPPVSNSAPAAATPPQAAATSNPAGQPLREGTIINNPNTGVRMILRNGQWVKL